MEIQKSRGQIFMFMLTHPIFLLAWFLFFRYTYKLCQYGGVRKNLPVIAVCGIFFLFWLILFLVKILTYKDRFHFPPEERWRPGLIYRAWYICAVIIIVGTAVYFGTKIVHSAVPYNGKLSWYLQDMRTQKTEEPEKENPVKEEHIEPGSIEMEEDGSCVFYLTDKTAYRLVVVDAAAGSRFYALEKAEDGTNWKRINEDPYNGNTGGVSGLTFLDEKLGFIALSHNGGSEGELYRTEDGGKTFSQVKFPDRKVKLPDGEEYNPFDTPEVPYKEGKVLKVKVGQGADGDYNGGIKAVYTSKDNGETWKFTEEAKAADQ